MKKLFSHFLAFGFGVFGRFLALIPHRGFLIFVKILREFFILYDRRRYKDAMSNLDFVYADSLSLKEKKAIIKRCYQNFAFVLLESARAMYIPKERHYAKFEFENMDYFLDCVKEGRSAVMISAHFGYWEAIGSALPHFAPEYGRYSLGRLTQFDSVNELIIQSRESYGVKLIEKKGAFKQLLKIYAKPKQIAGILVDQNMSESEAVWVKFFGKDVTHTPIASILSRRFDVEILPIFIDVNEDYTRFKIKFFKPFKCANTEDMQKDLLEATQYQASVTEEIIRQNPSSWLWFHKRFKAKYPQIYQS